MRIDSPGLTTDLELLRLQGSTVTDHGHHLVVRTEANPTFWWGNFVLVEGEARADEVDRWVARFEEEFPEARHRAVAFTLDGGDTEAWAARGWEVEGAVDLATTQLPVAGDVPDGIRTRPLEGDDDWEQSGTSARPTPGTPGWRSAWCSSGGAPAPSARSPGRGGRGGSAPSTATGWWHGWASSAWVGSRATRTS
ncbi:hypothetical protein [Terrabacter sp. NPDC080008]|uniref:hypothetical protein n=1 Tax=Terrabacter sp. NPDC080008 TaxID=3155176 RepID=UPI00344F9D0F